ncbi:MAG: type I restriction endonuclease subunit R [Methanosarcinales archaeon]|nr:type I restriction endonuclease subunit R [Methanosarcinales archaeon]
MNEDELEQLCLNWFRDNSWDIAYGPDIAPDSNAPERSDYHEVVLKRYLHEALVRINPHMPENVIEQAMAVVLKPDSLDLTINNHASHRLLMDGVSVEYRKDDRTIHDHAFIIDFENLANNRFLAVNQFTIQGTKQLRRPDVVCFINGLPIAVLELKSPNDENADIWNAFNQLQTYKNEINDLFVFNEALVVSDGYNARIGSLTANQERFSPWRAIKHEDDRPLLECQLETLVRGFFDCELLLDYIRFFVLFETDGEVVIKKIAGYHQFHAVREAVNATLIASKIPDEYTIGDARATYGKEVEPGSKKAGVFWHTQGSGKSISMCCYAGKLLQQSAMNNPTIVVVTDRNDLDGQLFQTFSNAQELFRQTPVQANSRDELRQLLSERETGGIIFTTVQKFSPFEKEDGHPILNDRHNIVVISDEAHRSQYGQKGRFINVKDKDGNVVDSKLVFGYSKYMRDALPNASFIGFTGTPIALEDKDTRAVFGDYVSIYDIQDAVDDGATVPIYYESRLAKLDLNHAEIEALSDQVEEIMEDEENVSSREKTKGEWSRLDKLVGTEPRIREVAADLVEHFETRTKSVDDKDMRDGKGMIVAMSREICVHLYNAIVELRPDWHDPDPDKGAIKIVMTGSASDRELLQPHIYNKQTKKLIEKHFKNINDSLKLVIVRDMWLTGFDVPCCHTMYIDKPMKGHNLMQAIARVNRVFNDKQGGLVVDYIGIASELKQALKDYTDAKGRGEPTLRAEEAYSVLLEKMDVVRGLFHGFDYSDFEDKAYKLLVPTANHVLGLDDGKKRYLDAVLAINKAYSLCSTLDEAKELRAEIAFFSAIKAAIGKFTYLDKKRTQEEKNSALKQILDNAVIAEGVTDVFELAGLDKPDIGLLSKEFLEDVRQMPYRNLAVELLEKLLKDAIKSKSRNNVVQEMKYGDRLKETLRKYNNRAIETAQVIEELIEMAKEFKEALNRDVELGLQPDEVAFYDALANNESAVRELGDEILKKIAVEITEKLRRSTTVDWQVRDSVRAKLRILVRRTLQRYKYPPDMAADAVELILKQAEVLSNAWTH